MTSPKIWQYKNRYKFRRITFSAVLLVSIDASTNQWTGFYDRYVRHERVNTAIIYKTEQNLRFNKTTPTKKLHANSIYTHERTDEFFNLDELLVIFLLIW